MSCTIPTCCTSRDWRAEIRARRGACDWCQRAEGERIEHARRVSSGALFGGPDFVRVQVRRVMLYANHLAHDWGLRDPGMVLVLCQDCHRRHNARERARSARIRAELRGQLALFPALDETERLLDLNAPPHMRHMHSGVCRVLTTGDRCSSNPQRFQCSQSA